MAFAELDVPFVLCCFNRFVAELEVNLSSGREPKDAVKTELFFATFASNEQLLNDAEFFTCNVLLTLNGTVQAELNEADRWTGMFGSVAVFST